MTPFLMLLTMLNPPPYTPDHAGQFYMASVINYWSDLYLVPRWWVMETAKNESSFRPKQISYKKVLSTPEFKKQPDYDKYALYRRVPVSRGLFQIHIGYEKEHAKKAGVKRFLWSDPSQSAHVGIALLSRLKAYYRGDLMLASAAYNAGPERIKSALPIPEETIIYLGRVFK